MTRYLLIAVGGGCGSMLRYFVGAQAAERFGPRFPVGTLSINVSACLLIGLVIEFLNHHPEVNAAWRFLIAFGFIGGFSTFSTFDWEVWSDITTSSFWVGLLYFAVSLFGGLVAVALGAHAARSIQSL